MLCPHLGPSVTRESLMIPWVLGLVKQLGLWGPSKGWCYGPLFHVCVGPEMAIHVVATLVISSVSSVDHWHDWLKLKFNPWPQEEFSPLTIAWLKFELPNLSWAQTLDQSRCQSPNEVPQSQFTSDNRSGHSLSNPEHCPNTACQASW